MSKKNKNLIRRRDSRERAVQILFSLDINKVDDLSMYLKDYQKEVYPSLKEDDYLLETINGILKNKNEIDDIISKKIDFTNTDLSKVVLAVLRLGVYEIVFEKLAKPIAISEAINIVKKYSSNADIGLVNAFLDSLNAE